MPHNNMQAFQFEVWFKFVLVYSIYRKYCIELMYANLVNSYT